MAKNLPTEKTLGIKGADPKSVTITQDQLNSILASMTKIAGGKEDNLRISIGTMKKEKKQRKSRMMIVIMMIDETILKIVLTGIDQGISRSRERSRDRKYSRERSRGHHRDRDSDDRDYHRSKSRERESSYDRHRHRYRSHSREDRHRDRYRSHSRDRDDRHRSRDQHRSRDRYRSESRDRDGSGDRDRPRRKRREKEKDREKDEKDEDTSKLTVENHDGDGEKKLTPRDVAGIPLALPWKHMTKAEQLRLLAARNKLQSDEEKAEEKELKEKKKESRRVDSSRRTSRKKNRSHEREPSEISGYGDRDSDNDDRYNRKEDKKKTDGLPPAVPKGHLTLAEKKKEQWARERAESKINEVAYTPWGKPGAGAPIRTDSGKVAADYKSRQDQLIRKSYERDENKEERPYKATTNEEVRSKRDPSPPTQNQQNNQWLSPQQDLPAAMRSSFLFGQVGDDDLFKKKKEEERRLWLEELDKQRQEKKLRQSNDKGLEEKETWADKFTLDYKPAGLPEQTQRAAPATDDTGRVSSAPTQVPGQENQSFIRGQNVILDPVTIKEMEEKRKRHLEHQQAVMEQVQEKQRQKQQERERKMREDMEEEMKLQRERDKLQQQLDSEQQKARNRELTPRIPPATHIEPTYIPGLNLDNNSPRILQTVMTNNDRDVQLSHYQPYTENRTLTPSQYRHPSKGHIIDPLSPRREFGTQTEFGVNQLELVTNREQTDVGILYKPGKKLKVLPRKTYHHREKISLRPPMDKKKTKKERDLWNYQNKEHRRPLKQSEKDPFYKQKKKISEIRKEKREQELLNLVEINKPLIPTERYTPTHSRDPSPGGHTPCRSERQGQNRRSKSHSPTDLSVEYGYEKYERTPRRNKSPSSHRSLSPPVPVLRAGENSNRQGSPPVPALRHRIDNNKNDFHGSAQNVADPVLMSDRITSERLGSDRRMVDRQIVKYTDIDPLEIPVGGGEFVPYTRTIEILDPANAGSPLPLSREATKIANARKEYLKGLKPGDLGRRVEPYEDKSRMYENPQSKKDPIFNPSLVKDHPTDRQSMILQQLSSLKENLIQRQRELETFSPTDLE
ncbi:LOW QUALITY PROTEIN: hypothetical protein KUTeg_020957 [Tegillarca granosa]|uniref:CCDC66 domain-containing protein n=1 Tax=Tegillarca granosa TaxID=220873 RepID=A0ABQ9E9X8_TEGGR|nr:LOW QUALITY PROTEIN: hypothetical protein KUTeg_020957 [Tegillarca granosa]